MNISIRVVLSAAFVAAIVSALPAHSREPAEASEAGKLLPRFSVADSRSITTARGMNTATVVKITNMSGGQSCDYRLVWNENRRPFEMSCDLKASGIRHGEARVFCTRPLPGRDKANIADCDHVCNRPLVAHDGKLHISSSMKPTSCERLMVEAYVVQSNSEDSIVLGMRNARIIRTSPDIKMRTNRGD